jgi:hypothetical protein
MRSSLGGAGCTPWAAWPNNHYNLNLLQVKAWYCFNSLLESVLAGHEQAVKGHREETASEVQV